MAEESFKDKKSAIVASLRDLNAIWLYKLLTYVEMQN
jgi:hypothetical protein